MKRGAWGLFLAAAMASLPVFATDASPPSDVQASRQAWGPLADLVGHDWLKAYPSAGRYPVSFAWKVPGRSIVGRSEDEETVYTLAEDGSIHYEITPTPAWDLPVEYIYHVLDKGSAIAQRSGHARDGFMVLQVQPNGQVVEWEHFSYDLLFPSLMSAYLRADGSTGQDIQVQNGTALRNPAAWGPFAALANTRIGYHGAVLAPVVSADGEAMHFVRVTKFGVATPEYTVRLGPNGKFLRRIHSSTVPAGYMREGTLEGRTIVWTRPGETSMQEAWRMDSGDKGQVILSTSDWTDKSHWTKSFVTRTFYKPGLMDDAVAQLQAREGDMVRRAGTEGVANARKAAAGPYNRFAQVANTVLDAGMAVYEATVPPPEYQSPPAASTSPAGSAGSGASAAVAQADASGSPATVFLWKGFQVPITPGATSNEGCYAKVVVGPVTTDSSKRPHEAKRAAASAERQFLAACRALGALVPGDFADEWYIDDRADSSYAAMRGNRWMHEVSAN